jgi:hypothetical protein
MRPFRCHLGKHEWERREDDWNEKYWVCKHCGKIDTGAEKYISSDPPGGGSGGV